MNIFTKNPKLFTVLKVFLISLPLIIGLGTYFYIQPGHRVNKSGMRTSDEVKGIKLVFVDSVDGRPIYDVIISEKEGFGKMYPEEIANGLNTGKWVYNEDLTIQ